MNGTVLTILIVAVLTAIGIYAVINYRRKLKSGCCGAGGDDGPAGLVEVKDRDESHYPYRAQMNIGGMTCEKCVARVQNALNRIDGVWAKVDLASGSADIRYKDEKLVTQMRMAVSNNGYTVKDFIKR